MQGFGTGPFEMLVPSSIGDMYTLSRLSLIIGTLSTSAEVVLQSKQWQCSEYPS
jgi:hypothetical protein